VLQVAPSIKRRPLVSQLFAFRVAKPIEVAQEEPMVGVYDPVSQTSTWEGGTPVLAVSCSGSYTPKCYAYGTYCSTSAGSARRRCD
jgi:hypothetical protein